MTGAGLLAGTLQWIAHQICYKHGVPKAWATYLVRLTIGVTIALLTFSIAYTLDERQNAIIAVWYVFGASAVGTWIAHAGETPHTSGLNPAMLDKFAQAIADEHDETH